MQYFELIILTMLVAQTLKYISRLWVSRTFSVRDMGKTYLYNSGFPSAHASVITASGWYFLTNYGVESPLVQSYILFSYFWLFEIYMQRKRHTSSTEYFLENVIKDKEQLKILRDLHGHSLIDLGGGMLVGTILYFSILG
jgi:acid phosphatase family membrane protein YuiD